MRTRYRVAFILAGGVAAFFLLAAILFAIMVDPNKFKTEAAHIVKEETGRDLLFEGDVRLSFFPRLGVKLGGLRLGNAPGFADKPAARVAGAEASVRILPLLIGRVEIGRVRLDGLDVHLERNAQGKASWADLFGGENAEDDRYPDRRGKSILSKLSLDGLTVKGGSLSYENRQTGEGNAITNLDAEVGTVRPGRPAECRAAFRYAARKPRLNARVEFSGKAVLDVGDDRHQFRDVALTADVAGNAIPGGRANFRFGLGNFDIDFPRQTARGTGLVVEAYGARGTGGFTVANLTEGPDVRGRIDFPAFDGRQLCAALTGRSPEAPGAFYRRVSAGAEFRSGKDYLEIPQFKATLDDAWMTGRLRLAGTERKTCSLMLTLNGVDADRLLPAKGKAADKAAGRNGGVRREAKAGEGIFPVAKLRTLRLDGRIAATRLKIKGLRFANLDLPLASEGGVLTLGPVSAALYGGGLAASVRVDVRGTEPVLTQSLRFRDVQARSFFGDIKGKPTDFSGLLDIETLGPLVCRGNATAAFKRTLTGRVRLAVRGGVFPGVNLAGVVTDARRRAGAGGHTGAGQSTRFGSMDVTAVLNDGVASFDDLEFKAPFLRATGRGTVNLVTKRVDADIDAKLAATSEGQGGISARRAWGIPVPVHVSGPYDHLSYSTEYLRALGEGAVHAVGGVARGVGTVLKGTASGVRKVSGSLFRGLKKIF